MGTRYLTVIIKDNKIRLSQYGQFDGYFESAGEKFVEFVKNRLQKGITDTYTYKTNKIFFEQKVDLLKEVDRDTYKGYEKIFRKLGCKPDNDSKYAIPLDILYPQFSPETGVNILQVINRLRPYDFQCSHERKWYFPVMIDTKCDFIEYAYIIDLDNDKLYMLTSHDFTGTEQETSELVKETFKPLKCWYSTFIPDTPTTKVILDYAKQIELTE